MFVALFDLGRMDRFQVQCTWSYKVSRVGQICTADHVYLVGGAYAGQHVDVRFDPEDHLFVFCKGQKMQPVKRCPTGGLDIETVSGVDVPVAQSDKPVQLSFRW
jgi:hypothetical protein